MNKAISERTHAASVKRQQERLQPADVMAAKNQRCKQRGEARKAANIARHAEYQQALSPLTPTERIARLDKAFGKGKGAAKERKRFATK